MPHSWIKNCLEFFGVADDTKTLLVNSKENWIVILCARNSELGEVDIKRGIFQGHFLSPLMFVITLIQLSFIL